MASNYLVLHFHQCELLSPGVVGVQNISAFILIAWLGALHGLVISMLDYQIRGWEFKSLPYQKFD